MKSIATRASIACAAAALALLNAHASAATISFSSFVTTGQTGQAAGVFDITKVDSTNGVPGSIAATDWTLYNSSGVSPTQSKATGSVIGSVAALLGTNTENGANNFLWADGSPTASGATATFSGGLYNRKALSTWNGTQNTSNTGAGFTVSIAAGSDQLYRARIFTGFYETQVTVTATLNGASTTLFNYGVDQQNFGTLGYFDVFFQANTPGDLLSLELKQTADFGGYDNFHLSAITTNSVVNNTQPPIPEPASLSLLALGGLTLLARRRRA